MGAEVHRGSLDDLESLRDGARKADAVIHTAFNHDFSKFLENCAEDRRAIEAMGAVLEGSDAADAGDIGAWRRWRRAGSRPRPTSPRPISRAPPRPRPLPSRHAACAHPSVRLAPSTHGAGDHGFVPRLIGIAREKGVAAYIGDGHNRWPGVHRLDAARLYRLALEQGVESGPYHAVADEGVPFKAIAEVIGRRLGVPVVSKTPEEAAGHFGWIARFAAMDMPASSARTRSALGWKPEQPGLIADLDQAHYFGLSTCKCLERRTASVYRRERNAGSAASQRRAGEVLPR